MKAPPKTRKGKWLTANEVAVMLDIHNNTAKRISPTELPYFRVTTRGDRRYRIEDVEAYIERRMVRR